MVPTTSTQECFPTTADASTLARAVEVLTSDQLARFVELIAWSPESGVFSAQSVDGSVRFRRKNLDGSVEYEVESTTGRNPLGNQDPTRFSPIDRELSSPQPDRSQNSYPYGYDHVAQIFDHPCAPDIVALHTGAHRYEGNIGNHGSLGVVQARAPFVASGPGIVSSGIVDGHCRLIDVAPTILELLGVAPTADSASVGSPSGGQHLNRQDGKVISEIFDRSTAGPKRALVFLLDGCNANTLYDAVGSGGAPVIAGLIDRGVAFRHGAIASLPTVTLANHTTLLTGCHPAHHGVLNNAWWDRKLGRQVVTESQATWHEAMQWLWPGVETIHQAIKRNRPGAVTYSVNEPADCGADYSTFEVFRQGRQAELLTTNVPSLAGPFPHATEAVVAYSSHCGFATIADTLALQQATGLFSGHFDGQERELPDFCWVNFSLTDAAFHDGGPHSDLARMALRDTDARVGAVLDAVAKAGVLDETAVFIVADHGMEQADPDLVGSWDDALTDAGIDFRDEAGGFIYLEP